jgi:Ca2+-binding EF-hand superfamily protein
MQIYSLANSFAATVEEMGADYVDIDGDGYVSEEDLFLFVIMMLTFPEGAESLFMHTSATLFTHGHAQLAVMMADHDGDGKLSMSEMHAITYGSYMDDTMTPEPSIA